MTLKYIVVIIGSANAPYYGLYKENPSIYPYHKTTFKSVPVVENLAAFMNNGNTIGGNLRLISMGKNVNATEENLPEMFNKNGGAVYIYLRKQSEISSNNDINLPSWESTEHAKIVPPDVFAGDLFGYSVALSTSTAVVDAIGDNTCCGQNGGASFIFDMMWQRVHFAKIEYVALEGHHHTFPIEIRRDVLNLNKSLTIGYASSDISAIGVNVGKFEECLVTPLSERFGCGDYKQTSGEITFEVGESSTYFIINIMDDYCWERHVEYVQLTLHIPGGVQIYGEDYRAQLRIDDNDWVNLHTSRNCTGGIS